MADETKHERVEPERWIRHPVSDHSDLDRPAPVYAEDLDANARAEFEQSLGERRAAEEQAKVEADVLAAKQAEKQSGKKS
jgi:hypothetical protein